MNDNRSHFSAHSQTEITQLTRKGQTVIVSYSGQNMKRSEIQAVTIVTAWYSQRAHAGMPLS